MAVVVIALVVVAVAVSWGMVGGTEFRNAQDPAPSSSTAAAGPQLELEPRPGAACDAVSVYELPPGQRGYPTIDAAIAHLVKRTDAVTTRRVSTQRASVFVRSERRLRILDVRRSEGNWLARGERSGPVGCAALESAFRR
jgi:uncharacterized membrane protein